LVRSANQVMLFRRLFFYHITALLLVLSLGSEEACCRWKAGVAATEKNRRIAIDEELLITGVSVSEENPRVLNGGVSASWMNDEMVAGKWCFSNNEMK
jgi:hypothetical protein